MPSPCPGGYIGVHTGLLDATRNESELAGVLAHEVAHVTQRHIARSVYANQRQSILTTAIMLGAILAGVATGDAEAASAGIAVAQGTAAQQRINFTRNHEYEADRIGIGAMADAGYDPHGMGSFFEVMSRQSPADMNMRAPEFLRTHPVTTPTHCRSPKSRPRVSRASRPATRRTTALRWRVRGCRVSNPPKKPSSITNGATTLNCRTTPSATVARSPTSVPGEIATPSRFSRTCWTETSRSSPITSEWANRSCRLEQNDLGVATFERAMALFPRNVPVVIHYGEWLLHLGQADKAHAILLDLMNNVPPTPEQVRLIARAASEAGDTAESLYYLSEYHLMTGNLVGGISFLQRALTLPELQEIQRIRFEARIDFIREFMSEEQLKQLQRSQPNSASARNTN